MSQEKVYTSKDEESQLKRIREILLNPEQHEIRELKSILKEKEKLKEKVDPIIEDQVSFIQENFPDVFGKQVDIAIEKKITESPDLLLSILSPILGRLIRKSIAQQFQQLRESIDQQFRKTFTRKGLIARIKARLSGVSDSDIVLSNVDEYQTEIKEIYVLQRDSGLLMANYSEGEGMDRDLVGGMLTAIKSFAEDVLYSGDETTQQDLEMIQYGLYKILIHNFYNYYIAVVMSGDLTTSDREEIAEKINDFAESYIKVVPKVLDSTYVTDLSTELENYFKQVEND